MSARDKPLATPTHAAETGPACSVVMPAYNAAATVESAIASVLNQTRGDLELIVVDDGSSDDTVERVRRFAADPRVRFFKQANAGPAVARNTALAQARGRYVSFLDSDDLLMPHYLECMTSALEAHRGAGWAYTDPWVLDEKRRRIRRHTLTARTFPRGPAPVDAEALLRALVRYNFVFVAATVRIDALKAVGGFTTGLERSEDYDLWLKLAAHGYGAVRPPGSLAIYRKGGVSRSTERPRVLRGVREIVRRVAEERAVSEPVRQAARERMAELDRALAAAAEPATRSWLSGSRSRARSLARRALEWRKWPATPPAEVAAAFPDLRAV